MAEYDTRELSSDPNDYISGPRRGQINRTQGGTTRDGQVAVLRVEEPDEDDTSK